MPGLRPCDHLTRLWGSRLQLADRPLKPYRPPQDGDHPPKDGPPIPLVEIGVRCWGWDCRGCGPGRRVEAYKVFKDGIATAQANYPGTVAARMLTVTYSNQRDLRLDKGEDLKVAHHDLAALIRGLRRTHGRNIEDAWVTEPTKRGRIHLHILLTGPHFIRLCTDGGRKSRGLRTGGARPPCYCSPDRPCVQRLAWSIGMGFVNLRKIDTGHRGGAYLSKYLTPDSDIEWPRYARRMGRSRKWGSLTFAALRQEWIEKVRALKRARGEEADLPGGDLVWELVPTGTPPLGVNRSTGEVLLPSRLR